MSWFFNPVKPKTKGIESQMPVKELKLVKIKTEDGSKEVVCASLEDANSYVTENILSNAEVSNFVALNDIHEELVSNLLDNINDAFKYECYRAIKLLGLSRIANNLDVIYLKNHFKDKFGSDPVDFQEDLCKYISFDLVSGDSSFLFEHSIFNEVKKEKEPDFNPTPETGEFREN